MDNDGDDGADDDADDGSTETWVGPARRLPPTASQPYTIPAAPSPRRGPA